MPHAWSPAHAAAATGAGDGPEDAAVTAKPPYAGSPKPHDPKAARCDHLCAAPTHNGHPCEHNCHHPIGHHGPHVCAQHEAHHAASARH